MASKDIVVIGGSTGSGAALKQLVRGLSADLAAGVFVTTHIPSQGQSFLPDLLSEAGPLPAARAVDGQPIEPGRIYVAPEDRHLLLIDGTVRLGLGPRENMVRPAIDPMFRSAAMSHGSRVIGVVLTGMLSDGAAGLHAIKQQGGVAVVQHPLDAVADEMPRAALQAVEADYVTRVDELAELIGDLVGSPADPGPPPPDELVFEVEVAAGARLGSAMLAQFAKPATLTCPDCHGVLSEVLGSKPLRYRCQIGHAYTAEILASRNEQLDEAIRIAMRVMEERVELVERMARDARETGRAAVAELYDQRAEEYRRYALTLREAATLSTRLHRAAEQPA